MTTPPAILVLVVKDTNVPSMTVPIESLMPPFFATGIRTLSESLTSADPLLAITESSAGVLPCRASPVAAKAAALI